MIGSGAMAPLRKLREAGRLIGVSPGRLYHAIADGRLTAAPGGGLGRQTLVSLEALQAFCQSEGLRAPDEGGFTERSGRSERSQRSERSIDPTVEVLAQQAAEAMAGQYLARVMERQSDYFEAFLREELSHLVNRVFERVVDQVAERLAVQAPAYPERSAERSTPALALPPPGKVGKDEALRQIRRLQGEGLSLQSIANQLNAEGIPTLSGKGRWQKGTISNLLAEVQKR
jgi:hypothetical protein